MGTEYRTVRIPKALADQADELAKEEGEGFRSRAEVVVYALRLFLREQERGEFDYEEMADR